MASRPPRPDLSPTAADWVRTELTVTDLNPLRTRPWADVWRVETAEGRWWLKVNKAGTTYEPRLLAHLHDLGSDLIPPSRVHPEQPWALLADAGVAVSDAPVDPLAEVEVWCTLLPAYAELQQASARVGPPVGAGVPDFSPRRLVAQLDAAWADQPWFTGDVTYPELDTRFSGMRARLVAVADQLHGGRAPTVQHDDLHGGNVFIDQGRLRLIDWGDAVWGHPLGTLLVTRRALAARWQVEPDDSLLARAQAAYLEPWRARGESTTALAAEVDLVLRTAPLTRVAGWIPPWARWPTHSSSATPTHPRTG